MNRFKTIIITLFIILLILIHFSPFTFAYVTSESMEPTLQRGDGIVLQPADDNLKQGDIITFYSPTVDKTITHKIVSTTQNGAYITKGANNQYIDQNRMIEPVSSNQIKGEPVTIGGTILTIPYGQSIVKHGDLFVILAALFAIFSNRLSHTTTSYTTLSKSEVINRAFSIILILAVIITAFSYGAVTFNTPQQTDNIDRMETTVPNTLWTTTIVSIEHGKLVETQKSTSNSDLTLIANPDLSKSQVHIKYYLYFHTLPKDTVRTLHTINPLLAAFTTTTLPILLIWLLTLVFYGGTAPFKFEVNGTQLYPPRNNNPKQ